MSQSRPNRRTLLTGAAALIGAIRGFAGPARAAEPAAAVIGGVVTLKPETIGPPGPDGLRPAHVALIRTRRAADESRATADNGAGRRLAALLRSGASGHSGDLYDNRDRGHSRLRRDRYPRLTATAYAEPLRKRELDYGLNDRIRFDAITLGNSSTALTGRLARSQARWALTSADRIARVSALYNANHLYVYPEHRDHDPATGDMFPAPVPQVVVSQGSSRSDQRILEALAHALQAFRPETKAALAERGLIAPSLQMLLRSTMNGLGGAEDYLSSAAHAVALDPERVNIRRLVEAAHRLTPETAPPAVRLRVLEETPPGPRAELFADGLSERIADTPELVARRAIGIDSARRYRLVAEAVGAEGRIVGFEWRVMRGPGVVLRVSGLDRGEASIDAPWMAPYRVDAVGGLMTCRVDVAVFARLGDALSAPAFFSLAFPPQERRRYRPDGRPADIDYAAGPPDGLRADPAIFPRRGWRDSFDYDDDGAFLGWTRRRGGDEVRFTAHGLQLRRRDARGRPFSAEAVRHVVVQHEDGLRVRPTRTGQIFQYRYAGAEDRIGTPSPVAR